MPNSVVCGSMVAYCYSPALEAASNRLPSNLGRASQVHKLINAFGLLKREDVVVLKTNAASRTELLVYHTSAYVEALLRINGEQLCVEEAHRFGLEHDCPDFQGLAEYVCQIAGASLNAARLLVHSDKKFRAAVAWDGGRHHAKKNSASGFCYVADAVLAIQELRKSVQRVIYVDLDVHHGDGVEAAFLYSDKVLTISAHRFDPGFFPNSGAWSDQGKGKGKGYSLNLPLRQGLSDNSLMRIIDEVINFSFSHFSNKGYTVAIVVQCGVDGLAMDPVREWNLTIDGFSLAVSSLQTQASRLDYKVLYLGGGGYDSSLASRCYASLTAAILETKIADQIPEHSLWHTYTSTNHEMCTDHKLPGIKDQNNGTLSDLISRAQHRITQML